MPPRILLSTKFPVLAQSTWPFLPLHRPPHLISPAIMSTSPSTLRPLHAKALTFPSPLSASDLTSHRGLTLHTHSLPPTPPTPTSLLLRFLAAPINPADINQLTGTYPSKATPRSDLGTPEPVMVGGNEGVAEVLAAGARVKSLAVGDWVVMRGPGFGTWRSHAVAQEGEVVRLVAGGGGAAPSGISAVQAATVSINPVTAWRMLVDFVRLGKGEWMLQNGANGAVGRAVVQLCREWGVRSVNVVRGREGLGELKAELEGLGADVVITDEELADGGKRLVEDITGGGELRLGLNCVGGNAVTAMAKVLAPGAHLVTYGAMSQRPMKVPSGLLIFKDLHLHGFWVSAWAERNPEQKRRTVEGMLELYRKGKFRETGVEEVKWGKNTKQEDLVKVVAETLEGFKRGKSVFVFEDDF